MPRQLMKYHPQVGQTFIPGLRARVPHEGGGYLLRTNRAGFRCRHEFDAEREATVRRVLLFGDSFTAGEGVSDGHRYGDWLERMIPASEVFNFGMPATGTDQHYMIYREFGQAIDHDVMVISVFIENIRRLTARLRHYFNETGELVLYGKPYFTVEGGDLMLHGVPVAKRPVLESQLSIAERRYIFRTTRFPGVKMVWNSIAEGRLARRWLRTTTLKEAVLRSVGYQPVVEYNSPASPAWQLMQLILKRWLRDHRRLVVLTSIPLFHHVEGISDASAYNTRFRDLAAATGCIYHDPLPHLASLPRSDRRRLFFERDGHLTNLGHEALASSLAPVVANAVAMARSGAVHV